MVKKTLVKLLKMTFSYGSSNNVSCRSKIDTLSWNIIVSKGEKK